MKGRIRRSTYFKRVLPVAFVLAVMGKFAESDDSIMPIYGIVLLASWVFISIQFIQRLHDINLSGWNLLWTLVPIANLVIAIMVLFKDSYPETNKWGPNPKALDQT